MNDVIAAEDLELSDLRPWWAQYKGSVLASAPTLVTPPVGRPYLRYQFPVVNVGAPLPGWYGSETGFLHYQLHVGDFDIAVEVDVRDGTDTVRPPGGAFRLMGLGVHDPTRQDANPLVSGQQYYYRMVGHAPGTLIPASDIAGEWKYRFLGAGAPTFAPRALPAPNASTQWVRIRRTGSLLESWHASGAPSGWTEYHSIDMPALPSLVHIGMNPLAVPATFGQPDPTADLVPNLVGRLYKVINYR